MRSSRKSQAALQMSSRRPVRPTQRQYPHKYMLTRTQTVLRPPGLAALKVFAGTPEAQMHKAFYDKKIASLSKLHALLNGQATEDTKRDFFAASTVLWDSVKLFILETLPAALSQRRDGDNNSNGSTGEGPFISGAARPGVDDFHIGAWLARVAFLLGAPTSKEGADALQRRFGPLPENVKLYWAAWVARDSWVKAYPGNVLH